MWSGQVEKFLLTKFKVWDAHLVTQSTWLFYSHYIYCFIYSKYSGYSTTDVSK